MAEHMAKQASNSQRAGAVTQGENTTIVHIVVTRGMCDTVYLKSYQVCSLWLFLLATENGIPGYRMHSYNNEVTSYLFC